MRFEPFRLSKFFTAGLATLTIFFTSESRGGDSNIFSFGSKSGMKKTGDLIHRQEKAKVVPRVYDQLKPADAHVIVSISKQRAYLMMGEEVAIDTPISSGKPARPTPQGHFHVLEKDPDHRSNIYGAFCDSQRRIVREGVSSVIDSAPSGTHFIGAPMKWFMRLTDKGVGMHVGILPGYAASHGCVRLPADIAPLIYKKVQIGTPVEVGQ